VIREQRAQQQLYYGCDEIARPASGNFYRRLGEAVKDWRALAAPFEAAFSKCEGRPTDPVVYLKIFLLGFLENIVYDTDLAERCADSIAIREFLGYGLIQEPPDHSSISRNRGLIGQQCEIEQVLGQVVAFCEEQGLVSGAEAAVDSSLIPANASLSSLRSIKTGKAVREHLREVAEKNPDPTQKAKLAVSNKEFRSGTDPDARLAKTKRRPRDMYYKATHVTDGKQGIILGADCERADVGEAEAGMPVVEQAEGHLEATGHSLGTVVGDAGYDDGKFHAQVEELGAKPLTNCQADGRKPKGFRKADFSYDAERDCYLCPAGRRAHLIGDSSGVRQYRTRAADCAACEYRSQCIGQGKVRSLTRSEHDASRERNLARCQTEAGQDLLRRRRQIVEAPFGYMKTYGGLGLINSRGLGKARVKVIMGAVAWNLKKLVRALAKKATAQVAACQAWAVQRTPSADTAAGISSSVVAVACCLLRRTVHTAGQAIGNAVHGNRLTRVAHHAPA
jgi:transposase/vacuolar-type H+-ATPase subunit E/Vma4